MPRHADSAGEPDGQPRVLLIDNDEDVTDVVAAVLGDEGYQVTTLATPDHSEIAAAVGRLEPDCVLLDSAEAPSYGASWIEAAYLAARERSIPTVMFSAHTQDVDEARVGSSQRAQAAGFAAIVAKPFDLDELLEAVATATGRSEPFNHSASGDQRRTKALAARLRAAGATDIRTGSRREWATFRSPHDAQLYQLYWWQQLGLYIVGRYDENARLERVGQFYELDAAIAAALGPFDMPHAHDIS